MDSIDVNVDREMTHRIFMWCHRMPQDIHWDIRLERDPGWAPLGHWLICFEEAWNQPEDNIITNLCALERYTYTIHIQNLHKYNMILYYLLQRKDELMSFSRKSRAISNHWTTGRIWKLQLGEDLVLGHRGTSWYHVISPFSKKYNHIRIIQWSSWEIIAPWYGLYGYPPWYHIISDMDYHYLINTIR